MLHTAFTPLPAADRIAGLLLHLEEAFAPTLTLTTLAVRRGAGAVAQVIVHLNDGSRHALEAGDARVMARCLRDDAPAIEGLSLERSASARMHAWADSLEKAAEAAERQASAILLGMGRGGDVVPLRQFGGRA
jgi:hypothetical protein